MYNKMKRRTMSHGGIFSSLGDFDETSLASSNLLKKSLKIHCQEFMGDIATSLFLKS